VVVVALPSLEFGWALRALAPALWGSELSRWRRYMAAPSSLGR